LPEQRPDVLAAFPPLAAETVSAIVGQDARLHLVASLAAARDQLARQPIKLVLCGVHFDESRMYDLLTHVRATYPQLPFICCRMLDFEIPAISREAIRIAAEVLGATYFLDFPALKMDLGDAPAERRFRALFLATLGLPQKAA
jgi:hypothetical protein